MEALTWLPAPFLPTLSNAQFFTSLFIPGLLPGLDETMKHTCSRCVLHGLFLHEVNAWRVSNNLAMRVEEAA